MKYLILVCTLVMLPLSVFGQSNTKKKFLITECKYSVNEKDYYPCKENVTNRIITYDSTNEKWILYIDKTEEYKVIDSKKNYIDIYESIVFQVVDYKNVPQILVYSYKENTEFMQLMKWDERVTVYSLKSL